MLPEGIVLWALIAAIFLATAVVAFALAKVALGRKRSGGRIDTAAGGVQATKILERRRSKRFLCQVRVFVYGHAPGKKAFHEDATTLEVSSHGGLLILAANVSVGQKLLLTNVANREERECRVVRFTPKHRQKREVAIEFARSAPDFWQTHTERKQAVS
jgi:PilZ domain